MSRTTLTAVLAACLASTCFPQTPRIAVWGGVLDYAGVDPLSVQGNPNPCVAADSAGNVYYWHRDPRGARILKWDAKGLQTTLDDDVSFFGICDGLVAAGNALYRVVRSGAFGNQIVKFDLHAKTDVVVAGTTATVSAAAPSPDGPAAATVVRQRSGSFTVDPRSGDAYFGADGPQIKKVSGGNITTIDTTLFALGLAVDASGTLYASTGTGIWKRQGSSFTLVAGRSLAPCPTVEADGAALSAVFCDAGPMAFDSQGDLYFLVNSTGRIKIKRLSGGRVQTILGGPGDPAVIVDRRTAASLVAIPGALVIGDDFGLHKLDLTTNELTRIAGFSDTWCCEGKTVENVQFSQFLSGPGVHFNANGSGVIANSGQLLAFATNRTVKVLAGQLEQPPAFGPLPADGPALSSRVAATRMVAIGNGEYVFCESSFNRVRRLTADGEIKTIAGNGSPGFAGDGGPAEKALLSGPQGVAYLGGRIYIADTQNHRIRMIDAQGNISTVAGTGVNGYNGENVNGPAAQLYRPEDLAVVRGLLYFSEPFNYRIRMLDAAGFVRTVTGSGGNTQHTGDNGPASLAKIYPSRSMTADPAGNIYFLEQSLCYVRKISAAGIISTIMGSGRCRQSLSSPEILADYSELSTDSLGNLYVSDAGVIRKVSFSPPVLTLNRNVPRSGPLNARILTLVVANARVSGDAFEAHLSGLKLTQTAGEECEAPSVAAIPTSPNLGFIRSGNTARVRATVDFGACGADARFTLEAAVTAAGEYSRALSVSGMAR